jgi:hypothetical protein
VSLVRGSSADDRAHLEAALVELDRAWLLESTTILGHVHDRPPPARRASAFAGCLIIAMGAGEAEVGIELRKLKLIEAGLGTTACAVAFAACEDRKATRYEKARALYDARRSELCSKLRASGGGGEA